MQHAFAADIPLQVKQNQFLWFWFASPIPFLATVAFPPIGAVLRKGDWRNQGIPWVCAPKMLSVDEVLTVFSNKINWKLVFFSKHAKCQSGLKKVDPLPRHWNFDRCKFCKLPLTINHTWITCIDCRKKSGNKTGNEHHLHLCLQFRDRGGDDVRGHRAWRQLERDGRTRAETSTRASVLCSVMGNSGGGGPWALCPLGLPSGLLDLLWKWRPFLFFCFCFCFFFSLEWKSWFHYALRKWEFKTRPHSGTVFP